MKAISLGVGAFSGFMIGMWKLGYVHTSPWWIWKVMIRGRVPRGDKRIGIFRNLPTVAPHGRWGFCILGFEFGSRNPDDRVGLWLKAHGMWPW